MSDDVNLENAQLPLEGAGDALRRARESAGKSIEQVAAETRIPQRHLQMIEAGDFADMPARTYAIGFSRSYAKAVGLDDKIIANQVREELAALNPDDRSRNSDYEPSDPARIPSRGLAWLTALAVVLLLAGGFAFFGSYFNPGSGPGPLIADAGDGGNAAPEPEVVPAPDAKAASVMFTALADGVWVKFYDGAGNRLQEKQMAKGETFTVPADAVDPRIWTGRPDLLAITIDGKPVAKLAEENQIMRDVAISAAALRARGAPVATVPPSSTSASGAPPET